jgi:hypothetical protein
MIYYFFVLLILVGVVIAILMAKLPSKQAANLLRWVLGVGGLLVGGLLTIRGLAVAGIPMIGAALGFLGVAMGCKPSRRSGGGSSSAPASTGMSEAEARAILGVGPDADEETIRKAHRTMMKRVHPDQGGSDALAAKVQEARDVLLKD